MKTTVVLLVLVLSVVLVNCQSYPPLSIGDRLDVDYKSYNTFPTTVANATANGWVQYSSSCDPNLGIQYTQTSYGPTSSDPISLYFTAAGQVSGVGVTLYGTPPQKLIDLGYWQPDGSEQYTLTVTFRDSSDQCSTTASDLPLGDRLIINANNISHALPLTTDEATYGNWAVGACFYSMGYHYFYDLESAPAMSWYASNLLPIVPMYNNGQINAFFFASPVVQQGITGAHEWDTIPLPDLLMCKNWCDSSCTFYDTSFWSTMHIFLRDYTLATCPNDCQLSCCPSDIEFTN